MNVTQPHVLDLPPGPCFPGIGDATAGNGDRGTLLPTEPAVAGTRSRRVQYEAILGQIATGVFILEPTGDSSSLSVTLVNETGTRFFGRSDAADHGVLSDANH